MKRLLLATVAGLMIAGPLSVPAFAQQGGYQSRQDDRAYNDRAYNDRDGDRRYSDRDGNRRSDDRADRGRGDRDRGDRDRGQQRRVSQYHDSRTDWRDTRRDARWNGRDHNGYYVGRSWHNGQPSARDYGRRGFTLGYRPWQRGDRLGGYNQHYREVDYRDYRDRDLRRPPQGYHWVENDNGDLIMAALVGGLIATIIANN
ncbi:MAG: RcnB family protein [Hyphomonadaceae bacterium]|nr:RcnB family protein [Hyphomonadaceae bacterium]